MAFRCIAIVGENAMTHVYVTHCLRSQLSILENSDIYYNITEQARPRHNGQSQQPNNDASVVSVASRSAHTFFLFFFFCPLCAHAFTPLTSTFTGKQASSFLLLPHMLFALSSHHHHTQDPAPD
jgi:hypothetical protein